MVSHTDIDRRMARFSLLEQFERRRNSREKDDDDVKLGVCGKVVVAYMTVVVSLLLVPFLVIGAGCLLVLAIALIVCAVAVLLLSCCCLPCTCCLPELPTPGAGRSRALFLCTPYFSCPKGTFTTYWAFFVIFLPLEQFFSKRFF